MEHRLIKKDRIKPALLQNGNHSHINIKYLTSAEKPLSLQRRTLFVPEWHYIIRKYRYSKLKITLLECAAPVDGVHKDLILSCMVT